jgi:hypothetical protein
MSARRHSRNGTRADLEIGIGHYKNVGAPTFLRLAKQKSGEEKKEVGLRW